MTGTPPTSRVVRTPEDAENLAARYMRWLGLPDAYVSPRGADGGIDVHSSRAIAQVKFRSNVTGRPDLQRLFGARGHANHLDLFFFTYVGYTRQALQYANQVGMLLFEYDVTGTVDPVNDTAHRAHLSAAARDRAARSQYPTPIRSGPHRGSWNGLEIALLTVSIALTAIAAISVLAWLTTLNRGTFEFALVVSLLAAACVYGLVRIRRPRTTRPATTPAATTSSPPVVVVTPRRVRGMACEYDGESRSVRRILVTTTGGTVVFTRDNDGHSTSLDGFSGFADPDEVRQARARARDELTQLGQTPWL